MHVCAWDAACVYQVTECVTQSCYSEVLHPLASTFSVHIHSLIIQSPLVHIFCRSILTPAFSRCWYCVLILTRPCQSGEWMKSLSYQIVSSQSLSLMCLQSCVHPLIVFKCTGAEWHSSDFMASRHWADSHSSSARSWTLSLCFHSLSLSLSLSAAPHPPTHLSLPPAPIHLISTPPSLFDSAVNREQNTRFLVSRRRRSCQPRHFFRALAGTRCFYWMQRVAHTRAQHKLVHMDLHTQAREQEHVQICAHMDVVHCAYSDSFKLKSFSLIWISAQFVLWNEVTLTLWGEKAYKMYT